MRPIPDVRRWFRGRSCKAILLCSLHAVWMIVLSLVWLTQINAFDGFDFMNDVLDYKEMIRNNIMRSSSRTDLGKKYLLINTSNNNQLLAADNDNQINLVITDRGRLTRALNILDQHSGRFRYLVCDIIFEEPDTLHDAALQDVISRLDRKNKLVIPFFLPPENEGYLMGRLFQVNQALSQYQSSFLNAQYLKFSYIVHDTIKQVPLVVFEALTGKKMERKTCCGIPFYTLGGSWCLNTIIPGFRYTSADLVLDETYVDLGFFTEDNIGTDQVVLIGDLTGAKDRHHSLADQVAGPLILINALEALKEGDNLIRLPYLLMLFLFFFIISWFTFYKPGITDTGPATEANPFLRFVTANLNYLAILLLTLVSMMIFHHYIHFFILMGYFGLIDFMRWLLRSHKKTGITTRENHHE